jgi:spermidine synthase
MRHHHRHAGDKTVDHRAHPPPPLARDEGSGRRKKRSSAAARRQRKIVFESVAATRPDGGGGESSRRKRRPTLPAGGLESGGEAAIRVRPVIGAARFCYRPRPAGLARNPKVSMQADPIPPTRRGDALTFLFGGTLFTSATLLFWIQPLFAKMTLPLLGGTPAVWTTAMVFYQAMLLAGYGYAHLSSRRLPAAAQLGVHAAVLALAAIRLPLAIRWEFDPAGQPIVQFLAVLTISLGLPFFAVAATAPLLQRWFSRSGHESGHDPYFLYGASNLGSILALLAFPFLAEPFLRLAEQSVYWSYGYALLAALILVCGVRSLPRGSARAAVADAGHAGAEVSRLERGRWVLLAAVPSSLMLGVTAHISLDLAPSPLLWVIPLALYLVTYVAAFSRDNARVLRVADRIMPYCLILAPIAGIAWKIVEVTVLVNLGMFFLLALICHGQLARLRPPVGRLTEFYFFLSLGGVLGGFFNAVVAPLAFNGIYEYPLALVLAVCLCPGERGGGRRALAADILLPLAVLAAVHAIFKTGILRLEWVDERASAFVLILAAALIAFACKSRPLRFGLMVAALFYAAAGINQEKRPLTQQRSFFSVYRVAESPDRAFHTLISGTTIHGVQALGPPGWREPMYYYARKGPLGQLFEGLDGDRKLGKVGLIGLGVGASLCYAGPDQEWVVFEIDPLVVEIARNQRYFHYWSECFDERRSRLRLGDGRLTLKDEPDGSFDVLMLDAYNSDSVPVHLLTREALALYVRKLKPNGVIAMHVSNRHFDLTRVVTALMNDAKLAGWYQNYDPGPGAPWYMAHTQWAVLARAAGDAPFLDADPRWARILTVQNPVLWTDDYSNIVSILK